MSDLEDREGKLQVTSEACVIEEMRVRNRYFSLDHKWALRNTNLKKAQES